MYIAQAKIASIGDTVTIMLYLNIMHNRSVLWLHYFPPGLNLEVHH